MKYKLITKTLSILILIFFSLIIKSQTKKDKEFSKEFYEQLTKKLNDTIPSIGSFIVSKNDKIICEQYFHGANRETVFDVKSVTKSVTSILTGIAKDKGLITDLDMPVLKILPE